MTDHDAPALAVGVTAMYGAFSRKGLVRLTVGEQESVMDPFKAREIAAMLLECAGAAEGDEILMRVLDRGGMSVQRQAHVLMAMRQERVILERRAREQSRVESREDQEKADLGN